MNVSGFNKKLSLLDDFKLHWKSFAPAWLFPLFFFYGGAVFEQLGNTLIFFWGIAIPLFFGSFLWASRPWQQRKVRYRNYVLLAMVLPFLIAGVAIFSLRAVQKFS